MNISIKSIQHKSQRYNTIGDYGVKNGVEWYSISKELKDIFQRAVFIHEFVENTWVKINGVSAKDINAFDKKWEKDFAKGLHKPEDEPGDCPKAPYYQGHQIASGIERVFIASMGADWEDYEKAMMKLWRPSGKQSKKMV
jgi:hypothetical protein